MSRFIITFGIFLCLSITARIGFGQCGCKNSCRSAYCDSYFEIPLDAASDTFAPESAVGAGVADAPTVAPDLADVGQVDGGAGVAGLGASVGATAGLGGAPGMIGDSFGGGLIVNDGIIETVVPGSGSARLIKIGQNSSPIPQCRAFFTYQHFHNALQGRDDTGVRDFHVNRYVFGWEQCFCFRDSLMSVEVRVPFSDTLDSNQLSSFRPVEQNTELGNLTINLKGLLASTETFALSAGLGINIPTEDDYRLISPFDGLVDLEIENESVHLAPFVGALFTPTDRLFLQSFIQFDFDTSGSPVIDGGTLAGEFNEQSLMFVDFSAGYWLHRNRCAPLITGIAGIAELHYTTTLQDTDVVALSRVLVQPTNRTDVLNLTGGLRVNLGERTSVNVGGVMPLRDKQFAVDGFSFGDRFFDAEFLVQLNRSF